MDGIPSPRQIDSASPRLPMKPSCCVQQGDRRKFHPSEHRNPFFRPSASVRKPYQAVITSLSAAQYHHRDIVGVCTTPLPRPSAPSPPLAQWLAFTTNALVILAREGGILRTLRVPRSPKAKLKTEPFPPNPQKLPFSIKLPLKHGKETNKNGNHRYRSRSAGLL